MKRIAVAVLCAVAPLCTWRVAAAESTEPTDPSTTTSTTVPPTTSVPPDPSTTTSTSTSTTTTTTTTPPTSTTTSVPPPSTTTTTTSPPPTPTTTVPTNTTTTTSTTTTTTTTTVPASTTTTTTIPPAEPDDPADERDRQGRTQPPSNVVDAGVIDGELRPITFPVAGPVTYFDDFGACRDGCRRHHEGNDVIGDRLQPLLAMHDGVIDHLVDHPTAGYGVVIRDREGWEYRVYHVNNDDPGTDDGRDAGTWRYAEGIVPGATVHAGQLIGWMGDSGNAEGSVPHAHVEIRRPDGAAINPYWNLRYAQRDVNCRIEHTTGDAASGWAGIDLPGGWRPLALTGGHPGSDEVAAQMVISPLGYTPMDAAAVRVGDPRYDDDTACPKSDESEAQPRLPGRLTVILATIRTLESGGDYTAAAASSTASGAYQFLDTTWAGYGGYRRARDAPPAVQDAKAAAWATAILERNGGDIASVPVSWYIGHVPVGNEWDTVPAYPGNTLTPREYQRRWLDQYAALIGRPGTVITSTSNWTPVDTSAACGTVLVVVGGGSDSPRAMLTQAQQFAVDAAGSAVPAPDDPCDPAGRPAPAVLDAALIPERPRLGNS